MVFHGRANIEEFCRVLGCKPPLFHNVGPASALAVEGGEGTRRAACGSVGIM